MRNTANTSRLLRGLAAAAVIVGATACQDAPSSPDLMNTSATTVFARGGGGTPGGPIDITACGTVITQPGKYRVAADLIGCAVDGIVITASNVTLHLDGHTISHGGGCCGIGLALGPGNTNVSVHGPGTIERFPLGGLFANTSNSRMSGVTIARSTWQGFAVNADFGGPGSPRSTNNEFYDNRFLYNAGHGVTMNGGDGNRFRGNLSVGNGGSGYFMFAANSNDYKDNEATGNAGAGFWTFAGSFGNLIQDNRASGNGWVDGSEDGICDNTWKSNTFGTTNNPACVK